MLPPSTGFGGAKISHQERIAGLVGPWAPEPGRRMHDRGCQGTFRASQAYRGLRLQVSGCGKTWKAFWLGFTAMTCYYRIASPHLTSPSLGTARTSTPPKPTSEFAYDIETPAISKSY